MFEDFGGGFDINKINGLAMDWDPTPILQALQNFSGSGATLDKGVAPQYPGMPNPEGVQTPWGNDMGGKPQGSLADIMYGQAAPAAPAAKGAAPLTPQQLAAMGGMMPRPPQYRPGPSPVAPHSGPGHVQFANVGAGTDPRASRAPSLAEILTGRRG